MVSIPVLTIATIGLLVAQDLTGSSEFLLGAYATLGTLAIAGAILVGTSITRGAEPVDVSGPSNDDIERVMTHNVGSPVTAKSVIERVSQVESESPQASPVVPDPVPEIVEPAKPSIVSASTDFFLNIGRRNKQLNRQMLTLIAHLERDELDPEMLHGLYELDHLATRMRRNEDVLFMLASSRKVRQWSPPVKLEDMLRSSLAEVERFSRVELDHVPDVEVLGEVVSNITHLLAELIDNATDFSHSSTLVTVSANTTLEGLEIEVLDTGHGIEAAKLESLNDLLRQPPGIEDAPARRSGLFIAARIAKELDIEIELTGQRGVGTVATISVPNDLLVEPVEETEEEESSPLDSIDLLDPVLQLAVGAELAEEDEDELATAALPTDDEVADALGGFPSVSFEVPGELADGSNFPSVPTSEEIEDPLPNRIPQATFESVWERDPLPAMPEPLVGEVGTERLHDSEAEGDDPASDFDDEVARDVASGAAQSISAFVSGVDRGMSETEGSIFDIVPEGEES